MIKGYKNEFEISDYINGKTYKELDSNYQIMFDKLFGNSINFNERIKTYIDFEKK